MPPSSARSSSRHLLERRDKVSDADDFGSLLLKARMLAMLHCLLRHKYEVTVICALLDPNFSRVVNRHWTSSDNWMLLVKFVVLMVCTCALPFAYGHTLMDYPCKDVEQLIDRKVTDVRGVSCGAEDFIRSWWALALAPLACLTAWAVFALTSVLDYVCWHCCACQPIWHARSRCRLLCHGLVDDQIKNLRYTAPIAYNWVTILYVFLLLEMVFISALLRSPVAALVGIAIARIFLVVSNVMLSPSWAFITKCEAEMTTWPHGEFWHSSVRGVLARLRQQDEGDTVFATWGELDAISGLMGLREIVQVSTDEEKTFQYVKQPPFGFPGTHKNATHWFLGGFMGYGWRIGDVRLASWETYPARFVYLPESNQTIDVVRGLDVSVDDSDGDESSCLTEVE
eukprot:TRINITY_DN111697_c0_g1_i1.p1 TRINITY_DN111697_c0_g1~~TRINITY_DN111697_c0_g1_i1.p1  ORF type:complete len:398 (-),score=10.10 TRINITY_DN111697_c0_g1_i1:84-1277(-)